MSESTETDNKWMARAISNAVNARLISPPNPWVGAVLVSLEGKSFDGWTQEVGNEHAEIMCINASGRQAEGGTLYTTLEPCSHTGNTSPCVEAIISANIGRVVVGIRDPDPLVNGNGIAQLEAAGIRVDVGIHQDQIEDQLRPYLHHRMTGRPFVVVKVAASLDGAIAAPDKTSKWITGHEARSEAHRLRAYSDAICVGAGTVRVDNPKLTVRDWTPENDFLAARDPIRIVLGSAPPDAAIHPCIEHTSGITELLDELGGDGVIQLLVEGGSNILKQFHDLGVVNQYEIFFAPALFGGNDAQPIFSGEAAKTVSDIWRGRITEVKHFGADIKVTIIPEDD